MIVIKQSLGGIFFTQLLKSYQIKHGRREVHEMYIMPYICNQLQCMNMNEESFYTFHYTRNLFLLSRVENVEWELVGSYFVPKMVAGFIL